MPVTPRAKKTATSGTPAKQAHLLFDAARAYLAKKRNRELELTGVCNVIAHELAQLGESDDYITHFFSALDKNNEPQKKYVERVASIFPNTRVHDCPPWEADIVNPAFTEPTGDRPFRHITNSSKMAFFMGAFYAKQSVSRIMLITDSFDLKDPIMACVAAGIPVSIIWFGQLLDSRYWNFLRDHELLELWDLDEHQEMLSVNARPRSASEGNTLNPFA